MPRRAGGVGLGLLSGGGGPGDAWAQTELISPQVCLHTSSLTKALGLLLALQAAEVGQSRRTLLLLFWVPFVLTPFIFPA